MKKAFNSKLNDIISKNPKKTLVVNKINPGSNKTIEKEIKNLFNNPDTFLQLPSDSEIPYVVGRRLQGPRYDLEDKLIPYSIVGNPKFIKNKIHSNNNNTSKSLYSNQSKSNLQKNINDNSKTQMSDDQIKAIFSKCKYNIENNINKKNDFLSSIPLNMKEYVIKPLLMQEKSLDYFKKNEKYQRRFKRNMMKKLFIKEDQLEFTRSDLFTLSENFITKRETLNYLTHNEIQKQFGNGLQNWSMSLRRPKYFEGERRGYVNVGSENKPYWIMLREKCPNQFENIMNPNYFNFQDFNQIMNKTHSFNQFMKTSPNFIQFINKTNNIQTLKIKGKNLLKVEEDNYKQLKGKTKKLLHLKYDRESLKDLNICDNWQYKTIY
jgi:hypothetical protein